MPAGKRQQSNAMLYSLVVFVGLFIVVSVLAVIYYVKFEDQKRKAQEAQRNLNEIVTDGDWRDRGKIVGDVKTGETYLGKMVGYLDKTVSIIIGPPGELGDTSAEVKLERVGEKVKDALKLAQNHVNGNIDPNITGLVPIIQRLKEELDRTIDERANFKKQLEELRQSFDAVMTETQEKEKQLLAEKEKYHQEVTDITQKYQELKLLMEKTSDERVKVLIAQLDQERADLKKTKDELLMKQAELNMTRDRMEGVLKELQRIKPSPDREVAAYKPDGKVILIDDQAGVVHLNIGADDRVYPGLTFSVYDRNSPIPRDGEGKAEVEVFSVERKISNARIIQSQKKNPIIINDTVANLVWDSNKTNLFVVAGEFDLNGDGITNYNAVEKIKALIEKWGGKVVDNISFDTDFLLSGSPPQVPPKPTPEDLVADPTAGTRYEDAMKKFNHYKEVQSSAQALWIPVFTYDRFLYFIGYKGQASKAGTF